MIKWAIIREWASNVHF